MTPPRIGGLGPCFVRLAQYELEAEPGSETGNAKPKETQVNKQLIAAAFLPVLMLGQAPQKFDGAAVPAPQILERIEESTLEADPEARKLGAIPGYRCIPRPRVIRLGQPDNFSPAGNEPLFLSPTAKAVWGSKLVPFDFAAPNRVFVVSMNLGQCKLCGDKDMKVALRVKRLPGGAQNDKAYLHFSNGVPNASGLSPALSVVDIWKSEPPTVTQKTVTLSVPLNNVNAYIFQNPAAFLEIAVQDDTSVDFVTVSW
jgi:hypothetical protein